jgi:hypothetical protein
MNSSNTLHPELPASEWRLRGQQDAKDARFDPPADPEARAAYEAGYHQSKDITP